MAHSFSCLSLCVIITICGGKNDLWGWEVISLIKEWFKELPRALIPLLLLILSTTHALHILITNSCINRRQHMVDNNLFNLLGIAVRQTSRNGGNGRKMGTK